MIDETMVETINEKPDEGSSVIFQLRWGHKIYTGVYENDNFKSNCHNFEGSFDVVRWKYEN